LLVNSLEDSEEAVSEIASYSQPAQDSSSIESKAAKERMGIKRDDVAEAI